MRHAVVPVSIGAAIGIACLPTDARTPTDPMLLAEVVVVVLVAVWLVRLTITGIQGAALARTLRGEGEPADRFDVPFWRLRLRGRGAFALGLVRPRIYLSEDLEEILGEDELRAILLHEDHHRLTRDPLRGAALLAWLTILGRISPVRTRLLRRLEDLECGADAHALALGIAPSTLASALVKSAGIGRAALSARGFGEASEARVEALLDAAAGRSRSIRRTPLEWLPAGAAFLLLAACHLAGLAIVG